MSKPFDEYGDLTAAGENFSKVKAQMKKSE